LKSANSTLAAWPDGHPNPRQSGPRIYTSSADATTFFKTLKSELVWRTAFQTRSEAIDALARYIDGFYNPRRRHSALGFTSPTLFERGFTHQTALH
jgi:transposase InsO family protein